MNRLCLVEEPVADSMCTTLGVIQRRARLLKMARCPFLLMDSVGFVEGLDEIVAGVVEQALRKVATCSRLLLLLVDAVHPRRAQRRQHALDMLARAKTCCGSTNEILTPNADTSTTSATRVIEVWTKFDLVKSEAQLKDIQMEMPTNAIPVSCLDSTGLDELAVVSRRLISNSYLYVSSNVQLRLYRGLASVGLAASSLFT